MYGRRALHYLRTKKGLNVEIIGPVRSIEKMEFLLVASLRLSDAGRVELDRSDLFLARSNPEFYSIYVFTIIL